MIPSNRVLNFLFLPEERSRMSVYLFFFLPGLLYRANGSRIAEEGSFEHKIKSSSVLLK